MEHPSEFVSQALECIARARNVVETEPDRAMIYLSAADVYATLALQARVHTLTEKLSEVEIEVAPKLVEAVTKVADELRFGNTRKLPD